MPVFTAQGDGYVSSISKTNVTLYTTELEVVHRIDDPEIYDVQSCYYDEVSNSMAVVCKCKTSIDEEVLVWNFTAGRFILAFSAPEPVLTVRIRREKIYLCTQNEIRVFLILKYPRKYKIIPTGDNVKGLLCLTPAEFIPQEILVFPASPGEIRIMDLNVQDCKESYDLLRVHNTDVSHIVMDRTGDLIATASVKGTIIRVFSISSREKLHELRRGVKQADIFCINFSRNSDYICVSSSKGTIHVFSLKKAEEMMKSSLCGQITNPRSYASVKSPSELQAICFYNCGDNLSVLGRNGLVHQYTCKIDGRLECSDVISLS